MPRCVWRVKKIEKLVLWNVDKKWWSYSSLISSPRNRFLLYIIIPLKPSFTWPLSIRYDTQFQTKKNVLKKLMKALLFHKFKNICIKTMLWTMNTRCLTIFVHRNFRRKVNSKLWVSYSIVPRPCKWGLKARRGLQRKILCLQNYVLG